MRIARIAAVLLVIACEHGGSADAAGQTDSGSARGSTSVSAPSKWKERARKNPEIAGWLYLRAAAETPDSADRAELYGNVNIAVARDRIPWVEAQAREHFDDLAGALRQYRTLDAPISVFRLRATLAHAPAQRDSVRGDLMRFIASSSSSATVRDAYSLFDRFFPKATPAEELTIARAAARVGAWGRARHGFENATPAMKLSPQDRFAYASSLARANQDRRAAQEYARVISPKPLAAAARYQRARSLLGSSRGTAARSLLRTLSHGPDTSAAAALSLLADLESDDGNDVRSRALLLEVARRFPTTRFAWPARFNAALIAFIRGQYSAAGSEFAALSRSDGGIAAAYWLGRAHKARGETAAAARVWRGVISRDSTSYYATLAAARLGTRSLHRAPVSHGYPRVAAVDSALVRIGLLQQLDMAREVSFENERLFTDAPATRPRLLATAAAFAGTAQASRAIVLGRRALAAYGSSPDVYRLIYPVSARDTIIAQARRAGIDPALVAALVRQESSFNPRATSPVGARGLMQLMPSVARAIAAGAGIKPWSTSMLYDPGINITLGIRHLAPLVHAQPSLPRVLAAYNAGESRVKRWALKRGASDPEMFTERIPFAETRGYVKSVLRNREFYRALYAW